MALEIPNGYRVSMAAGDVNGDGMSDLVITYDTDSAMGNAEVWLSKGYGTFDRTPRFETVKGELSQPVLADVDGDGRLDLVLCSGWPRLIQVLYGRGDATFQPGDNSFEGFLHAIADFDHDGISDLLCADRKGLFVRCGRKDRTFATEQRRGKPVYCVAVADFNGDEKQDLLTWRDAWFQLQPDGGEATTISPRFDDVNSYRAWDMDGDGCADMAWLSRQAICVMKGTRDGSFKPATVYMFPPDRITSWNMLLTADCDGDGNLDMLPVPSLRVKLNAVNLLRGKPDGTFNESQFIKLQENATVTASDISSTPESMPLLRCLAADFNGDGKADLAWLEGRELRVAMNVTGFSAFLQISPGGYALIALTLAVLVASILFALHKLRAPVWYA